MHIETLEFEFYKYFISFPQNQIPYFHTFQIMAMLHAIMNS